MCFVLVQSIVLFAPLRIAMLVLFFCKHFVCLVFSKSFSLNHHHRERAVFLYILGVIEQLFPFVTIRFH